MGQPQMGQTPQATLGCRLAREQQLIHTHTHTNSGNPRLQTGQGAAAYPFTHQPTCRTSLNPKHGSMLIHTHQPTFTTSLKQKNGSMLTKVVRFMMDSSRPSGRIMVSWVILHCLHYGDVSGMLCSIGQSRLNGTRIKVCLPRWCAS